MIKKNLFLLTLIYFLIPNANASLFWNINTGINEYKKNNFKYAKEYFVNYVKNNPNDKDGYYWLAKIYLKSNKKNDEINEKIKEYFKKSYELTLNEKDIEKISFNTNTSDNIEDYFDMASMYFEDENYKEAQIYADLMLKINPKSESAYFMKAKIAYVQNKIEKAKELMNYAILYNNELLNTNLSKELGIIEIPKMTKENYNTFALEAYFHGDLDNAIKYYKKYLELDNSNLDIMNMLTDLYIKNDDILQAQKNLDETFKINSNNIQAFLLQAKIYALNNDSRQKDILLKAHQLNPNNPQTLLMLGNYYLNQKDFEKSKEYFEILVNIDDSMYEGYFGYIYSLLETGENNSQIINLLRKISSLNPESDEVMFLFAKYCENQGSYFEAYDYMKEALQQNKNPNYLLEIAKINYVLKRYSNSIAALKDATGQRFSAINQDEIDEFLTKNYIKTKDKKSLEDIINKKSAIDKNPIMYKYNLYNLYKIQGDDKKAEDQYLQIKKIKPNKVEDYIQLSEIFYDLKGYEQAIKILDNAIKKHIDCFKIYSQKLKIYFMAEEEEKFQEVLSQIEKIFK